MNNQRDTHNMIFTGILGFVAGGALVYQLIRRSSTTSKTASSQEDASAILEQVMESRRTVQAAYFDQSAVVSKETITDSNPSVCKFGVSARTTTLVVVWLWTEQQQHEQHDIGIALLLD